MTKKHGLIFSPESHNVIWCGKQVLRGVVLPVDLFRELNDRVPSITIQLVDCVFKQMLYDALDTDNEEDWLKKIKIFQNYNSEADLTARRYLMASILKILEVELKAMTVQLKDQGITDERLKYDVDGTILLNRIAIEILLSEVSSAFAENNKAETSFSHYKALFGLLMMLKTIARRYTYASFKAFKGLKVHFIHTHNQTICHWTMSTPSLGLFLMNKKQKMDIIEKFEEKSEDIMPFMTFSISLGVDIVGGVFSYPFNDEWRAQASVEGSL
ncbi:hypothetical protein MFLAVUS_002062 [Mucor flavus]|uniref:Uncharacterized protein n=1 Tax=Mucor flavus TaxID=439312 RepID=A0ABP9YP94_9FUNG